MKGEWRTDMLLVILLLALSPWAIAIVITKCSG